MGFLRELWLDVRDTVFVIAQVITLGVVAMVLGMLALNAALTRPAVPTAAAQSQPQRPLTDLVPTLVAMTATPTAAPVEPTATPVALYQPPGLLQPTATAAAPVEPTQPPQPTATPVPPTPTPKPEPTERPEPTETPKPRPSPTSEVAGQLMKVLPAQDGLPARVRAEPSTKSPILLRVPLGATVEVIGQASGDEIEPGNRRWLRIRWKNQTGWVYSSLVGE